MTDRYREQYKEEAKCYDARRYRTRYGEVFTALHYRMLEQLHAGLPTGAHLLDVACGTGHASRRLLQLGFRVTGLDLNREMISRAPDVLSHPRFDFVEGDAFNLPFENATFDGAVATRFLHLFGAKEQAAALAELARVISGHGQVVVDYDNLSSHAALAPALIPYNLLRYGRFRPDTNYSRPVRIRRQHEAVGLHVGEIHGLAGYHLLLPALIDVDKGVAVGIAQRGRIGRLVGEQLVVRSTKN